MIVIDTSALMAILEDEPEAAEFDDVLRGGSGAVMGAPTLFELNMVAFSRKSDEGLETVRALLESYAIDVREWGLREAQLALDAFARYGKGRHPAALNFGDCMAYALARSLDAPLLFKGDDFAVTDVRRVSG